MLVVRRDDLATVNLELDCPPPGINIQIKYVGAELRIFPVFG
jgi:hypothetical protein